jgi:hypothetical protein
MLNEISALDYIFACQDLEELEKHGVKNLRLSDKYLHFAQFSAVSYYNCLQ